MSHRNISEPEKPIKYKIGVKYHVQVHEGPRGGGGGKHYLIWPRRVSATEQGMAFKVLSVTQGIQFHYLVSYTGYLSNSSTGFFL